MGTEAQSGQDEGWTRKDTSHMELNEITERVRIIHARLLAAHGETQADTKRLKAAKDQTKTLLHALEADCLIADLQQVIEEVRTGEVEPWRNLRPRLEHLAAGWDPF